MNHRLYIIISCIFASFALTHCSYENHFKGTWMGHINPNNNSMPYTEECVFTEDTVHCAEFYAQNDPINSFGGNYEIKSPTQAVSQIAGFVFNLNKDGTLTFDNTSITKILKRFSDGTTMTIPTDIPKTAPVMSVPSL